MKKRGAVLGFALMSAFAQPVGGQQVITPEGSADTSPSVLIVPPAFVQNTLVTTGCWARLYRGSDFSGESIVVAGPVSLPRAELPPAFRWGGSFDSLELGAKTTLTAFADEDFSDRSAVFEAGARVGRLDDRLGEWEGIRSMRLTCAV